MTSFISTVRITLLALLISLVSACITPTSDPMLVFPDTIITKSLMSVKQAQVVDIRSEKTLAVVNGEKTPANPELESQLTKWLKNSVTVNPRGRLDLTIEIVNYATYIMQGTMQFEAESVMEWQVNLVGNNGFSWKKKYQTTIKQDGPMNMDKSEIEIHLNKMANTLLSRTLEDPEFNTALNHR
jgi:uncharacterized lipoprotein YajG